ncbi:MAG TPA: hypothetical protein PK514_14890, partial [Spirochaetota bacterium]|nr:hypothetical protein [Spirochaetota bacterium]
MFGKSVVLSFPRRRESRVDAGRRHKKNNLKVVSFIYIFYPGGVLLSHIATHAVPSAMRGLTS